MLTQVLPHPPDSGPKVKTGALLASLGRRHEVTLVSFTRGRQDEEIEHLRGLCAEVHGVPLLRGRWRDAWHLGRSLLSGRSFLLARDDSAEMRAAVRRLAAARRFDIVHADQLNMAPFAGEAGGAARVLDAHNALWSVTQRLERTLAPGPRRLLLGRETKLLRACEGRVCREFEGVLAVSEEDRAALLDAAGADVPIAVVPIAVDAGALPLVERSPEAHRILHLGSLLWPPTADGLEWFLREVWPRIRAARPAAALDVVGADPPARIAAQAGAGSGVRLHGYVADLLPLLRQTAAMVVPVRAGGGMRVRILHGLAQGIPMVTTPIGHEGIAVRHGRELLVAGDAEAFARSVLELLDQPPRAAALARAGRALLESTYDANVVYPRVDAVYAAALARARSRR